MFLISEKEIHFCNRMLQYLPVLLQLLLCILTTMSVLFYGTFSSVIHVNKLRWIV